MPNTAPVTYESGDSHTTVRQGYRPTIDFPAAALLPVPLLAGPGPLSPAEALEAFEVEPGVRVELAAAEPLVRDPVALCLDGPGRMYVVESRG